MGTIKEFEIGGMKLAWTNYNRIYSNSNEIRRDPRKYNPVQLLQLDLGKVLANYHLYLIPKNGRF